MRSTGRSSTGCFTNFPYLLKLPVLWNIIVIIYHLQTFNYFRHCIPGFSFQYSSGFLFVGTTPLLKEKSDSGCLALIFDVGNPFFLHGPGFSATFYSYKDTIIESYCRVKIIYQRSQITIK